MALEIDTAVDHVELFDRLIEFLQLSVTSPGGPDWQLLEYDSSTLRALFQAPGLSGTEEIHVGLSLHASPSTDTFALGIWMFRAYVPSLDDLAQPGHSGVRYLPLWDTAMPYWFMANGQRLIVAAKVSTTYQSAYVGKFLPYGVPGEYPQPYYLAAPVSSPTTRWSSTADDNRNFWDPGGGNRILLPSGAWWQVAAHTSSGETPHTADVNMWPYAASSLDSSAATEYAKLRENVDGTYGLLPMILMGRDPTPDIYGELDGAFAVTGFGAAAEDTISIGGDSYVIVQDRHRTNRYNYAALKLE